MATRSTNESTLPGNSSPRHHSDTGIVITEEQQSAQRVMAVPDMIEMFLRVCSNTAIIFFLDTNGVIVNLSELSARRLNKQKDSLVGKCMWEVLPPEVAAVRKQIMARVLETGHVIRFEDEREGQWLDSIVFPVSDASGNVIMVVIIGFDISKQKYDENYLKEEKIALEWIVRERTDHLEKVNQELEKKTQSLEDMNVALRVLLEQRDRDRAELEQQVLKNVEQLIRPSLERLMQNNGTLNEQRECIQVAIANLDHIVSPFLKRLSTGMLQLTPQELQVANLIKGGMATKAIARYMHISVKTVEVYRRQIRKKLGLTDQAANLKTHLISLQ